MAKTRAQRKAERRAREEQELKRAGEERGAQSRSQHDTQVPISGEIAEIEAVEAGMALGAPEAALETSRLPRKLRRSTRNRSTQLKPRKAARRKRQGKHNGH